MSAPPAHTGEGAARSAVRPKGLPPGTVSWLEIDLGAVRDNVCAFAARLATGSRLVAVVKSDAYGHGTALVAPAALEAGAAWLAAGGLGEGIALRQLVGPAVPILLLNHVPAADAGSVVEHDLRLTLYDADALPVLSRAALRLGRKARVHVKIETGTNRQGLAVSRALDLARLAGAIPGLELEGIATHFADIEDTTDHAFAERQLAEFSAALNRFRSEGIEPPLVHAACSAATILFPETHFQLARAGIGIYGLWPSRETLVSARERGISGLRLRAAMSWKCLLAQVKDVPAGSYVGYGRTWRATRPSRIAVVPVGYYEGYARALSGGAHVLLHGQRAPVIGRVCMNMCMVDVTDIQQARAGDVAVLLGQDGDEAIRAEDLATWANTIHYEIVSRIHPSLPRIALSATA